MKREREMSPCARRGLLIAIEGCDRGGKSTQCMILQKWLTEKLGTSTNYLKFPDRSTAIGGIINEYLTGQVHLPNESIHLLFSANRWELAERMESLLVQGQSIVLDRYVYSGVAYTSAKVARRSCD